MFLIFFISLLLFEILKFLKIDEMWYLFGSVYNFLSRLENENKYMRFLPANKPLIQSKKMVTKGCLLVYFEHA